MRVRERAGHKVVMVRMMGKSASELSGVEVVDSYMEGSVIYEVLKVRGREHAGTRMRMRMM